MKKSDKAREILNGFDQKIQELEKKIESPETEREIRDWLKFHAQFHNYSFRNTMWLMNQAQERDYQLERVAPFKTWTDMKGPDNEKVFIQKGSKGFSVLFPMEMKLYEQDEKGNFLRNANGKKISLLDENGKEKTTIRFGVGYVFDVKQTNAREIGAYKDLDHNGKAVPIDVMLIKEISDKITDKYKIPVIFDKFPNYDVEGWYSHSQNSITVNLSECQENAHILGTLLHELGHSQMHRNTKLSREAKEGQAEAFAYAAASVFGIELKSELYIKSWMDNNQSISDVMKNVAKHVDKAFKDLNLHELSEKYLLEHKATLEKDQGKSMGAQ